MKHVSHRILGAIAWSIPVRTCLTFGDSRLGWRLTSWQPTGPILDLVLTQRDFRDSDYLCVRTRDEKSKRTMTR